MSAFVLACGGGTTMRGNMEDVMKYYEKQNGEETFVMAVDENGNYSVASNLDSEPDGFTAPADPLGQGYKECSQQRAEEILGYGLEDESIMSAFVLACGGVTTMRGNHYSATQDRMGNWTIRRLSDM